MALDADVSVDHPEIARLLTGLVVEVICKDGDIHLRYADGRVVRLVALGWEAEAVGVELLEDNDGSR